ncbi:uncharacterized protein LOC127599857 [Hippocampus zosterae]|uniref:uncharacterized protein LOC127599857 n=1 Tax=Hippocampus zosterae TaxID=109293 RepID=UPI00223D5120|nr:uncharacterized protein LOC127599857 [Hippocampus zosterae]
MEGLRPPPILSLHSGDLAKAWKTWKEQFALYVELTMPNAEEATKCNLFHILVGEEGRRLLKARRRIDDASARDTVRDMMRTFDELWNPKRNETAARYAFFTRDQATGENVDEYVAELRALAGTCHFEQLKDSLIKDRIVCGTNDSGLRERLLREENLTLDKCLKICRASEPSRENCKTPRGQSLNRACSLKEEKTSKDLGPGQQVTQFANIKEEVKEEQEEEREPLHIKEEQRKDDMDDVGFIAVTVKSDKDVSEEDLHPESPHVQEEEDYRVGGMPPTFAPLTVEQGEEECQSERSGGTQPPNCSSSQPVTTEGGAGQRGRSRADRDGDITSRAHYTDVGEKYFVCSVCHQKFRTRSNFKVHVRTHTGEKPFACSVCGKTFSRKGDLGTHSRTHTGEKPFACLVCGQHFSERGSVRKHARTHTVKKPFACCHCGKTFTKKDYLRRHVRTHTGEKPFACSVCGQQFSARGGLRKHARIHSGEKPFACSVCDKRFNDRGHLKTHSRTHTGEKPFACLVCGQQFSERGSVRRHARTHTGEKPFACCHCGKTFAQKAHLRRHTRTHTGEKPFSCSQCNKHFTYKNEVTKHDCAVENSSARTRLLSAKRSFDSPDSDLLERTEAPRHYLRPGRLKQEELEEFHEEYEEDVCGPSKESERRVPDADVEQPPLWLRDADVSEDLVESPRIKTEEAPQPARVKEGMPDPVRIKVEEEPEAPRVKEDEREDRISKSPLAGVIVKSEGAHRGGTPSDGLLAPLSDSDDVTSHSSDYGDDDDDDGNKWATEKRGDHHRVEMCTRRVKDEECDEELWRTKEEKEPRSQALCKAEPRVPSDPAVACLGPERQVPEKVRIKDEAEPEAEEPLCVKEEEREDELGFPLACVTVKIEEGDEDHRGGSHSDGLSAPPSESEHITSHSSDYDDGDAERATGDGTCPTDAKRVKCSYCDKTFCRKSVLKVHTRKHTGERPFVCSVCGKGFIQKGALRAHVRTHTGEKPFACSVCGKSFIQKGAFRAHAGTHTGEKPFVCAVCGKRFFRKGDLRIHIRTHTGEKPCACSVCGKCFTRNSQLTRHAKTHTGEKPFACAVCGKSFTHNATLTRHAKIHTGDKPFACSVCGKSFTQKGDVKVHARTHTREKHFACSVCGQIYDCRADLRTHARTHSGEKRFACPVCGSRFARIGDLRVHERTHTGEKPFACSFCGKRFLKNGDLRVHTRTHTGEKPYACSVCGKKFTRSGGLKKHAETHAEDPRGQRSWAQGETQGRFLSKVKKESEWDSISAN